MEKVLNSIMEQMECSLEDAKIILENTLNNSKLVQRAITNAIKNEYEL